MDTLNLKTKVAHPIFEYMNSKDAGNLIDCQISGEGCVADSIAVLLSAISPVLRSVKMWDRIILADLDSESLNEILRMIYTGRCFVTAGTQRQEVVSLLQSLGISNISDESVSTTTPSAVESMSSLEVEIISSPSTIPSSTVAPVTSALSDPVPVKAKRKIEIVKCKLCDANFSYKFNLVEHMKIYHGELKTIFSCDICKLNFKTKHNLKRHLAKACSRNHKFMCVKCHKTFLMQDQLDIHSKCCKMKYCCDLCKKYFMHELEFRKHLGDQHDEICIISVMK